MKYTLIVLGLLSVLAQPARAQRVGQATPEKIARVLAAHKNDPPSGIAFPDARTGFLMSQERGFLTVDAIGRFDHRTSAWPTTYYWRLEVYPERVIHMPPAEGDKLLLWGQSYDRKEFTVLAHTYATRQFHERLQLPPGRYQVRLHAYDVKWELFEWGPELVSTMSTGELDGPMSSFIATVK